MVLVEAAKPEEKPTDPSKSYEDDVKSDTDKVESIPKVEAPAAGVSTSDDS